MLPGSLPDVFLDTDVAFDAISVRIPFHGEALSILELAANGKIRLMISEVGLANLTYLTLDIYKVPNGKNRLLQLVEACEVVAAGKETVIRALKSPFRDKEDALQYFAALKAGADYYVTRNRRDYRPSASLPVLAPSDFLSTFSQF